MTVEYAEKWLVGGRTFRIEADELVVSASWLRAKVDCRLPLAHIDPHYATMRQRFGPHMNIGLGTVAVGLGGVLAIWVKMNTDFAGWHDSYLVLSKVVMACGGLVALAGLAIVLLSLGWREFAVFKCDQILPAVSIRGRADMAEEFRVFVAGLAEAVSRAGGDQFAHGD